MPSTTSHGPGNLVDNDPEQFWYHMPEALVEVELSTSTVTYANRMAEVLLGYSAEEFADDMDGKTLVSDETYQMIVDRAVRLAGSTESPAPNYQRTNTQEVLESIMVRKDGSLFEAEGQGSFVLSENGTPIGMRIIFRDTTARKRTERTVAGSAEILELIAAGTAIDDVLRQICLVVERIEQGSSCAIALSAAAGGPAQPAVGPGLGAQFLELLGTLEWSERFEASGREEGPVLRCCVSADSDELPKGLLNGVRGAGFNHFRAVPITAGDGTVMGAVIVLFPESSVLDISDNKPAEQAARLAGMAMQRHRDAESQRNSERRYRTLAERASDVIFTLNGEGRFTSINRAGVELTGYSLEAILERNVADLLAPANATLTAETLQRTLDGRLDTRPFLVMAKLADGSRVPFEISIQAIEDESGGLGFQGIGRDIRARIEAEEAVRENERLIDGLLQQSPVSIWVWDRDGTIKSALGAHSEGVAGEFVGRNVLTDIYKDNTEGRDRAKRALRGESISSSLETNGRSIEMTHSPIFGTDGKPDGVIVTSIDITEQTRIGAEAARLEGELRQSHRLESIGRLASGVAHDFNNILAVTMGSASLIKGQVDKDSPIQQDVEAIIQATERAATLTQQLLAFGGKQELRPQLVDVGGLARDMGDFVQRVLRSDIELSVTVAPEVSAVHADAGQLEQVLMNLAVNARDAMPDGGTLTIDVRENRVSETASIPAGTYVVVRVSDNGTGMSEKIMNRVFEPFFSTKPAHLGTGLGLSTALGIVTQSGGHLHVKSELGTGTTFSIYLPVAGGGQETT